MDRKPNSYQLVFIGAGLALWLLFHSIWNILFEDWLKYQLEHMIGRTFAEMIERFGAVGFPALIAGAVVWLLYSYKNEYDRAGREQSQSEVFKLAYVYCETKWVNWEDGEQSAFFENRFYIVIGNALESGETLRRTQARVFHIGEPTLSAVKETGAFEVDIRHGELAFFKIGKVISPEKFGNMNGSVTLSLAAKKLYSHNMPLGGRTFEVAAADHSGFGLGYMPEGPPWVWSIWMVISADEVKAMQVRVRIDLAATETPVTCETIQ